MRRSSFSSAASTVSKVIGRQALNFLLQGNPLLSSPSCVSSSGLGFMLKRGTFHSDHPSPCRAPSRGHPSKNKISRTIQGQTGSLRYNAQHMSLPLIHLDFRAASRSCFWHTTCLDRFLARVVQTSLIARSRSAHESQDALGHAPGLRCRAYGAMQAPCPGVGSAPVHCLGPVAKL